MFWENFLKGGELIMKVDHFFVTPCTRIKLNTNYKSVVLTLCSIFKFETHKWFNIITFKDKQEFVTLRGEISWKVNATICPNLWRVC